MQRLLFAFGTRPEAIKLAPVILHTRQRSNDFHVQACVTAQHRHMLDQVLDLFSIEPEVDLNLMQPGQDLFDLTARVILGMRSVLRDTRPDWVIVQGDTTTAWTVALAAFYEGIKVAHVEAGLRTFDKRQPFPEEVNRRLCTQLADLHLAPTPLSRENLLAERVGAADIVVTGNPVIDALLWVVERCEHEPPADVLAVQDWARRTVRDRRMVLITGHRRESFGQGFMGICTAIAELAAEFRDVCWVYPVHLNPNVQQPVQKLLGGIPNVHLTDPQTYASFAWLMKRAALILTDSGGIQEEAPSLGKRALVMRNTTERPEGVEAGCVKLVGNKRQNIVTSVREHLTHPELLHVDPRSNPYGNGQASRKIADAIATRASEKR
jgi:UDP-N-acetylglucosamine 2-epimerase (non-hydrolysing)